MSEHTGPTPSDEVTREDVLVGRVVDGAAAPHGWRELERLASRDSGIWERLANAQRAHERLERAVEDAIAVAELVDLPGVKTRRTPWALHVRTFGGWAVAACLAIAMGASMLSAPAPTPTNESQPLAAGATEPAQTGEEYITLPNEHGATTRLTSNGYYDRYIERGLQEGRVLREVPSVIMGSQTAPDGSVQLVYMRRVIETAPASAMVVPELHVDEAGRPVAVPVKREPAFEQAVY
ncbi:MAG: hypothetical protein AAGD00_03830 [Planctomycetota bacterium]